MSRAVYRFTLYRAVVTHARFSSIETTMIFASIHFRMTSQLQTITYLVVPWRVSHRNDSTIDRPLNHLCTEEQASHPNTEALAFLCENRFRLREPRLDHAVVRNRTTESQHVSQS